MRLGRNLAAGLAHSLLGIVVGLAAVPYYIHHLGVEAYGLIGFQAALQGLLLLLDLGLAPAISREVSRAIASDEMPRARALLHSLTWVYWGMALLIGGAFFVVSPMIAESWLNSSGLGTNVVANAVLLIGLLIAGRWPSSLYFGALTGAHRLADASALGAAYTIVANVGAVLVLAFWSATIQAFFLWQAGAALVYTIAMRWAAWRVIGDGSRVKFDLDALKSIWRFSLGMSAVALTATVFTQLDKLILTKLVTLTEFAYYSLATVAAGVLYGLVRPVFNVLYPRFSTIVATNDVERLSRLYRASTSLFALIWFPGTMTLSLCAEPLLVL